jgi:hypothetical protein
MPAQTPKPLTSVEIAEWLDQHVRSRVHATLAQPRRVREQIDRLPSETPDGERAQLEFLLQASWEGRHAAFRWLIEFVGVIRDKHGNARPSSKKYDDDFRIDDLPGGKTIPIPSSDATLLADLWNDCTKATGHSTRDSGHKEITEVRLSGAAEILIRHLRSTIYAHANKSL